VLLGVRVNPRTLALPDFPAAERCLSLTADSFITLQCDLRPFAGIPSL
jgi:hypothetical protein